MSEQPTAAPTTPATGAAPSSNVQLALATVGFAINFWAWALISPLGKAYGADYQLSDVEVSVLVAVPVIVGSLGRIPVGALTDRLGARTMFPIVSLATIVPVLTLAWVQDSFPAMIV